MSKRNYAQMVGTAVRAGVALYRGYNQYRTLRRPTSAPSTMGSSGNFVRRVKVRTGRVKRWNVNKIKKHLIGVGNEIIYRHQATSATYIGPGLMNIGFNDSPTANLHYVPIHFMSLTHQPIGQYVDAKGCPAVGGMKQLYYDNLTGAYGHAQLPNQNSDGSAASNGTAKYEQGQSLDLNYADQVFHKYTDIKINLYGSYTVPVHYNVFICTMKEQIDPLKSSVNTLYPVGSEMNNMFRDMTRPLLFSSVGHNSYIQYPKDMRIIKSHRVTIQPLPYSDQQAEGALPATYSKSPNIHELRWFIRHDRYRSYKWSENTLDTTTPNNDLNSPQWDMVNPINNLTDCEWGKKLFLFITATCPKRGAVTTAPYYQDDEHAIQQGSYDICIRNAFRKTIY